MHPGFHHWWKRHHGGGDEGEACRDGCQPGGGCGHGGRGRWGRGEQRWEASGDDDGGGFGVRRPLRFLAHKLELEEDQVAKLAAILSELKTERAQAAVDQRRRIGALADAVEQAAFDEARVTEAGDVQVKVAERLRAAVTKAVRDIHAVLDEEQRRKLAYLLRTGVLSI
jgi:Spy/CpxP family protein refolding chaperone